MEDPSPPLSDLSLILAVCAGKGGRCGMAYVDLDGERVLYVADVVDPDFTQLDRDVAKFLKLSARSLQW